jgi:hypothetical protein
LRAFFLTFTLFGLGASVLVHSLTFIGISAAEYVPWVWVLHLGIFIAIIPLVGKRDLLAGVPPWASTAVAIVSVYAIVNFFLFILLVRGGGPEIVNGKYVLASHGSVIRELSEREYHWQQAYVLRGFSGHWMMFYLPPALYWWYRKD